MLSDLHWTVVMGSWAVLNKKMLLKRKVWVNSCEWPQVDAGRMSVSMPYQLGWHVLKIRAE